MALEAGSLSFWPEHPVTVAPGRRFRILWFVDFRVLIAIQPVDYQFGAFTAYTVGINGDDFQRHVVFVKITNQGRQVEGRVGVSMIRLEVPFALTL